MAQAWNDKTELTSIYEEEEEGCIGIKLKKTDTFLGGNLCVRRTDEKSNFQQQEDIKIIVSKDGAVEDLDVLYDYTIESGVAYKYGIQQIDKLGHRSLMTVTTDKITRDFQYSFLLGEGGRQLKLKFDNTMQNFKIQQAESKTDTIGSKYPKTARNAAVEYRTFPIAGLISFQMDDNELFQQKDSSTVDGKPSLYNTEPYNYNNEKKFRDEVLKFLQDGKPKLFKSPTEGNIIVRLMDVTCTPNQTLNRMIYSFTSNAYETDEATMENYRKYGFYEVGDIETDFSITETSLGQVRDVFKPGDDIIDRIFEEYEVRAKQVGGKIKKIKGIHNITITIEDKPYKINNSAAGDYYTLGANMYIVGMEGNTSNTQKISIYNGKYVFDSRIIFTDRGSQKLFLSGDTEVSDGVTASIDFIYDYSIETYLGKDVVSRSSKKGIGQIHSFYKPDTSIYNDIYYKYYKETNREFSHLERLYGIEIEAKPGTRLGIRDKSDLIEYEHEVGETGILRLYDLSDIKQIRFIGTRQFPGEEIDLVTVRNSTAKFINNNGEVTLSDSNTLHLKQSPDLILLIDNNQLDLKTNNGNTDLITPRSIMVTYYYTVMQGRYKEE